MNDRSPFDEAARQALDTRAEGLDGATLSRLRQARVTAIEQGTRRHRWFSHWVPVTGALATAALLAMNLWHDQMPQPAPELALLESLVGDSVLPSSTQPDPEFIEWLARPNGAV